MSLFAALPTCTHAYVPIDDAEGGAGRTIDTPQSTANPSLVLSP